VVISRRELFSKISPSKLRLGNIRLLLTHSASNTLYTFFLINIRDGSVIKLAGYPAHMELQIYFLSQLSPL